MMSQNKDGFRFRLFIYLASVEFLLSGVTTAFLADQQGLASTLSLSALAALAGLAGLFVPAFLKRKNDLAQKVTDILKGMIGRSFPFIVILLLSAFFLAVAPTAKIAVVLSPLLVCIWLIGVEILLLFDSSLSDVQDGNTSASGRNDNLFGIIGIILAYGFLLIPSRIPAWLDGFPWDSPAEFILAIFILPLTFMIGWKVFPKRFFVLSLAFLFVVKFIFFSFLPQTGLGIYAFKSEEAASAHQWDRSYYTFATPDYTQVINRPYYALREFPVEWINNRFGFDKNQFWLKLELSGYVNLQQNERLVFVAQGAKQMQAELLDVSTQEIIPLVFVEQIEDVDSKLFDSIPESNTVKIQGTLLFDHYGQMRLEPFLLYPDGTTKSLFESPRVWTSLDGANYPVNQVNIFGLILNALSILFAGLIFIGLFVGIRALLQTGKISLLDLYLALSGLPLFFVVLLIQKQYMNILALTVILGFYIVKLTHQFLYQRYFSGKAFLFSIGIPLLFLFLALDTFDLHLVTSFPPFQDGLEYQTFAHNIYVNLDVFLANTPPRAYKVLFPYIVGILHILFGHSASAQLFINTWCAILSGALMIELMKELRLNSQTSLTVAVFYLSLLFLPSLYIFYFRFGLIEPFSTTLLLLTYYFAIKHQRLGMFISGIFTVLLRLDYLGIAFTAVLLTSTPMLGTFKSAWMQFFDWLKTNWKLLAAYMFALCSPVLLAVLGYFLFIPNYMLNAYDTDQTSLASLFEGLTRVVVGGTAKDLSEKIIESPADVLLISTPLLFGFVLVFASTFLRTGIFKKLDLRLGLLALSLLPAYIVVRPAAYFPRFSLPLLPLDLIIISLFFYHLWSQNRSIESHA
jgi:hypothetical protein